MKNTVLSESAVRRRAKGKGLRLKKRRSSPPYRKPYRVVEGTTIKALFGTPHHGQSLAACAAFISKAMPSCEDIKARLRALDARKAAFTARARSFKNARASKIWPGLMYRPLAPSPVRRVYVDVVKTHDDTPKRVYVEMQGSSVSRERRNS